MTEQSSLAELSQLLCLYEGVDIAKITIRGDRAVFSLRIADAESIARLEYFGRVANAQTGAFTQCIPGGRKSDNDAAGKWVWHLTFELEPDLWVSPSVQIFALFLIADLRRRDLLSRQESRQLQALWAGDRAA